MKKLIILFAILFAITPVKAADFTPPDYLTLEERASLDKLPVPLVISAYTYLAHSFVASRTLKVCQKYPIFVNIVSQYAEIEENNAWEGQQFVQQVAGGLNPVQIEALKKIGEQYGREIGSNKDFKTAVPLTNEKLWCEYRGTVLFDVSIQKILNVNYENYLKKKEAWVQATQDLSMLVIE